MQKNKQKHIKTNIRYFSLLFLMCSIFLQTPIHANTSASFQTCIENEAKRQNVAPKELKYITCPNISELAGIDQLESLEILDISSGSFTTIPESISKLSTLKSLDISDNQIETITDELKHNTQLEALYIANNQLYSIADMRVTGRLKLLDVSGNNLITLGTAIDSMSRLEALYASTNQLILLPSLTKNVKLEVLDAQNNQLTSIPSLTKLPIETLLLDRNLLQEKSVETATGTYSVENNLFLTTYTPTIDIKLTGNWSGIQNDLQQMIEFNNGIQPVAFQMYNLVNVKDSANNAVAIEEYLNVQTGTVFKNSEFTANIEVKTFDEHMEVLPVSGKLHITIDDPTLNVIVPPIEPKPPVNPGKPNPPVNPSSPVPPNPPHNETPSDEGQLPSSPDEIWNGDATSPSGAEEGETTTQNESVVPVEITPEIPPRTPSVIEQFMLAGLAQEDKSLLSFAYIRFIILNMLLVLLALIPLLALIFVIRRTRKMYEKTSSIVYNTAGGDDNA